MHQTLRRPAALPDSALPPDMPAAEPPSPAGASPAALSRTAGRLPPWHAFALLPALLPVLLLVALPWLRGIAAALTQGGLPGLPPLPAAGLALAVACADAGLALAATLCLRHRPSRAATALLLVPAALGRKAVASLIGTLALPPLVPPLVTQALAMAVSLFPLAFLPLLVAEAALGRLPGTVAAALGAGPWQRFRLVLLPALRPALAAGFWLCLAIAWAGFVAVAAPSPGAFRPAAALAIALPLAALAVAAGAAPAWALARPGWPGRRAVMLLLLAAALLPGAWGGTPPGADLAAILTGFGAAVPLATLALVPAMAAADPLLPAAARACGAGKLRVALLMLRAQGRGAAPVLLLAATRILAALAPSAPEAALLALAAFAGAAALKLPTAAPCPDGEGEPP